MGATASLAPDPDPGASIPGAITVTAISPMWMGKLITLASVGVEIDSVAIVLHGIRAMHSEPPGARVKLPRYRDADGVC
jgi:hypothetical protein